LTLLATVTPPRDPSSYIYPSQIERPWNRYFSNERQLWVSSFRRPVPPLAQESDYAGAFFKTFFKPPPLSLPQTSLIVGFSERKESITTQVFSGDPCILLFPIRLHLSLLHTRSFRRTRSFKAVSRDAEFFFGFRSLIREPLNSLLGVLCDLFPFSCIGIPGPPRSSRPGFRRRGSYQRPSIGRCRFVRRLLPDRTPWSPITR